MTNPAHSEPSPPLIGNWLDHIKTRLDDAEQVAVCLDFDGTLAPIVEDPTAASMPERAGAALQQIADTTHVAVVIVSGRAISDVETRLPVTDCVIAGNHGLEIQRANDHWVHPDVVDARPDLEQAKTTLESAVDPISGCHLEDKQYSVTVHFRGAEISRDTVQYIVTSAISGLGTLQASDGRQIVEIRPDVSWDKGDAVTQIVADDAFAIYVGDDTTDEDAFHALQARSNGGLGILVGDRPSAADFRVHDVDGVRAFLEWLAELDRTATTPSALPNFILL